MLYWMLMLFLIRPLLLLDLFPLFALRGGLFSTPWFPFLSTYTFNYWSLYQSNFRDLRFFFKWEKLTLFVFILCTFVGLPEKNLQKNSLGWGNTKHRKTLIQNGWTLLLYKQMTKGAVLGSVRQKGITDNPTNNVLHTEQGRDASSKGTLK